MPTPQNFLELVDTVYDTPASKVYIIPKTKDAYDNTSGQLRRAWDQMEWLMTIEQNALTLTSDRNAMGLIHRVPDTMLARQNNFFTNFANLIPRGRR